MLQQDLERWIFASACKAFDDRKQGAILFFEETNKDDSKIGQDDFAEFRLDGPYFRNPSKDYWIIDCEINIFVTSRMNHKDFHRSRRTLGIFRTAMTDWEVLRLGDGPDDDQSLVGCMRLTPIVSGDRELRVSNFGQIDTKTRLVQACVEGHYRMELS